MLILAMILILSDTLVDVSDDSETIDDDDVSDDIYTMMVMMLAMMTLTY
jgi:hypothetical protein